MNDKERYHKRKDLGLCMTCPNKVLPGKINCKECRDRRNKYQRIRLKRMKDWEPKRYKKYLKYVCEKEKQYQKTERGRLVKNENSRKWRAKNPDYFVNYRKALKEAQKE